jgi:hypothetical protein
VFQIRNKLEDIQRDVALPPCHIKGTLPVTPNLLTPSHQTQIQRRRSPSLQPSRRTNPRQLNKYPEISPNFLTLASRYEGKNSLFDAINRKYAFQSLARLREACFFYSGLNKEERILCSEEAMKDLNFEDKSKSLLSKEEEEELKVMPWEGYE